MSNFLGNLIARAAQRASVLERRQHALFEPVAPWAGPVPATIDRAADPYAQEATFSSPRPSRTPAAEAAEEQPDADVSQAAGEVPLPHTAERKGLESPPRPAPRRTAQARTIETASPVSTRTARAIPSAEPAIDSGAEDRVARNPRPVLPKTDPLPYRPSIVYESSNVAEGRPTLIPESQPYPRAETLRAEALRPSSPITQGREFSDAAKNLLAPAVPRITHAVQLAKAIQPSPGNRSLASANSAPPSVHVTIGRVEVRAVAAAERATARTAKPAAPRLTLDDYLRERSKSAP
ncbi:MAG TPA: hypothetical protein VEL80_07210 [Burkholderiales bacterium]|nr:hypothetical protein [Burkholderiales bacterium]